MSTIRPDLPLDRTAALASQAQLEGFAPEHLRHDQGSVLSALDIEPSSVFEAADVAAYVDAGETLLNADAWEGASLGERFLAGDARLQAQLGALDLPQAADQAADLILGMLA